MARAISITGPSVVLYVNGVLFSEAVSISATTTTTRQERRGIDSTEPYEISVSTTRVNGSVSCVPVRGRYLESRGITVPFTDLSREQYFSIEILDRVTGETIWSAFRCQSDHQHFSVAAKSMATLEWSFTGIEASNAYTNR